MIIGKVSYFTNFYFTDIASKLKSWSDIRWDSRWSSINTIIINYGPIAVALEDLIGEGDHRAVDARGILSAIKEPIFITAMFILNKLFGSIKILSDRLKSSQKHFREET